MDESKKARESDKLAANFGSEGLSLKISLPKWAKIVIAVLLAIGFLESFVIVKAIEIHERYEKSQIEHGRLIKELTEQVQQAEKEKQQAELATQASIYMRLLSKHASDMPLGVKTVSVPQGKVTLTVFPNGDLLIARPWDETRMTPYAWLINP
jgi:hypothetical protein